jgi:hypothetical protein
MKRESGANPEQARCCESFHKTLPTPQKSHWFDTEPGRKQGWISQKTCLKILYNMTSRTQDILWAKISIRDMTVVEPTNPKENRVRGLFAEKEAIKHLTLKKVYDSDGIKERRAHC